MSCVKLYRVILPVSDIEKSTAFYRALLQAEGERVSPGRHYFNCGGTILACFDPKADGDGFDARPNPDHIYFSVADLDAAYDRMRRAGAASTDEQIRKMPWGERMFYARDPFGNPFAVVDEKTVFTGGGYFQ